MRPELHVALRVAGFCVRMGSDVVEEPRDSARCDRRGLGLFAGDVAKRNKYGRIDCERVVQEATDYFLDDRFVFRA